MQYVGTELGLHSAGLGHILGGQLKTPVVHKHILNLSQKVVSLITFRKAVVIFRTPAHLLSNTMHIFHNALYKIQTYS